ncbi:MAG: tripartite tricarboxylate transporter TctB family protein [Actinophytocola sp.]|nr:tripartite tricarboxylate transporter TctB family protein [Actinophytocola sp.]
MRAARRPESSDARAARRPESSGTGTGTVRAATRWLRRHSEFGMAAFLVALGALVIVDALSMAEDFTQRGPVGPKTVPLLVGVFCANIMLIDVVGFPISGAILFWGAAYALGSRNWVRDPLIAVALSVLTYFLFVAVLGVPLPGGPLAGVV